MNELINISALEGFHDVVRELGGEPSQLLIDAGMDSRVLDLPGHFVSYRAMARLLDQTAETLECPHFGLLLSRHQGLMVLSTLGFVMQQGADLGTALKDLKEYFHVHTGAAVVDVVLSGRVATLTYEVMLPGLVQTKQIVDLSLGAGKNILSLLCGAGWKPNRVSFCHDTPKDLKPYVERFGAPLSFNQEFNGISFDAALLRKTIANADEQLRKLLLNNLENLKAEYPNDVVSQVRQLIRTLLPTGTCSIDRVAECLNMSRRSLQLKLSAQGVHYKDILEEVRRDVASKYLAESDIRLTELGEILGYSELSAFSRAFKRWFGKSPVECKGRGETLSI